MVAAGNDVLKSEDADHITCLIWKTPFNVSKLFCSKAHHEERGDSVKMYQERWIHERRRKKIGMLWRRNLKKSEEAGRDCNKAKTFLSCCSLKKAYLKEELNKAAGERKEKRKKKVKTKKRKSHGSTKEKNKGRC